LTKPSKSKNEEINTKTILDKTNETISKAILEKTSLNEL
jgi:hypothetical protein